MLTLRVLGPEGVIIIISDLESFNYRTFLDIQFLISARQDIIQETSVVPGFNVTYRLAMEINVMCMNDLQMVNKRGPTVDPWGTPQKGGVDR